MLWESNQINGGPTPERGITVKNKGPGARAGERSLGRAQNDKFLTVGVRNTPTMFCITSARVDESVAVAAPMPMVPTRAAGPSDLVCQ